MSLKELEIYRKEQWIKDVIVDVEIDKAFITIVTFNTYIERLYKYYKDDKKTSCRIIKTLDKTEYTI